MLESFVPARFSGCVLVCKDGLTVDGVACGVADEASGVKNDLNTRFPIASGSKGFVAAAILKLVHQGRLTFETSLAQIFRRPLGQIDMAVTLRQLLSHTSGVPDYFDESVMDDFAMLWQDVPNYRMRTIQDLLPLFLNRPMVAAPGTSFAYSNSGFVLLGLALQEVTGMPFDQALQDLIFEPAGMQDTAYESLDRLPRGCAQAYVCNEAGVPQRSNLYSVPVKGSGDGGAFSTAPDMDRFWNALFSQVFFPRKLIEAMLQNHRTQGQPGYGLGVWLHPDAKGRFLPALEGSDPGVEFSSFFDPLQKVSMTCISNHGQDAFRLQQVLLKTLRPEKLDPFLLQTDRLVMRWFCAADADALHEYLSDPKVVAFEPYAPLTIEQAKARARAFAANPAFYAVCLQGQNQVIGHFCLIPAEKGTCNFGFVFSREHQGKGLATEGARALLKHAFTNLNVHRIVACCSTRNDRSIRLLERLSFQREGLLRRNISLVDESGQAIWHDSLIHSLLSSDFGKAALPDGMPGFTD